MFAIRVRKPILLAIRAQCLTSKCSIEQEDGIDGKRTGNLCCCQSTSLSIMRGDYICKDSP